MAATWSTASSRRTRRSARAAGSAMTPTTTPAVSTASSSTIRPSQSLLLDSKTRTDIIQSARTLSAPSITHTDTIYSSQTLPRDYKTRTEIIHTARTASAPSMNPTIMTPRPVTASSSATTRASAPSSTPGPSPSRTSRSPGQPPQGSTDLARYKLNHGAWRSLYVPVSLCGPLGLNYTDVLLQLHYCLEQRRLEVYDLRGCRTEDRCPLGLGLSEYAIMFVVQAEDVLYFALAHSRASGYYPYTLTAILPSRPRLPREAVKVVGDSARLTRPVHNPVLMGRHIWVYVRYLHILKDHASDGRLDGGQGQGPIVDPDPRVPLPEKKRQFMEAVRFTLDLYAQGKLDVVFAIFLCKETKQTEHVFLLPLYSRTGKLSHFLPLSRYDATPPHVIRKWEGEDADFGRPLKSMPSKPNSKHSIRLAHTVLTLEFALRNAANAGTYWALQQVPRSRPLSGAAQGRRAVAE
eukprot:TRINITY_DN17743_c0_g1_i1.p1 TRINITY_DN17743_c0_g1~~TRINITY_DN17743_c0_g1_i1.p1  ORF type:complete len:491 (+),score=54.02 TRINITY_DN17743_c0_g1_i1:83-1474(+)